MCGRFVIDADQEDFLAFFTKEGELPGLHPMPPRFNIAPTQPVLTILGHEDQRQARLMRWAFLPDWVKNPADFTLIHNARAETAATKPSFRNALRYRRCLIPASGFYEWQRSEERKQPYYMSPTKAPLLAMAGIWETWMGPNGEEQDGCAILTCKANSAMGQIHHRMPVLLDETQINDWLDCRSGRSDHLTTLMQSQGEDFLRYHPVSEAVNRAANDSPALIEPVAPSFEKQAKPKTEGKEGVKDKRQKKEKDNKDQLSLF